MTYGLYYLFYSLVVHFGYLWSIFILFISSFILSKLFKYNFLLFDKISDEFYKFILWYCSIITNVSDNVVSFLCKYSFFNKFVFFLSNGNSDSFFFKKPDDFLYFRLENIENKYNGGLFHYCLFLFFPKIYKKYY